MSKPIITIHNAETDEIISREMTDAEYAEYQANEEIEKARLEAIASVETKKLALLEKLGITEDEAKLLLA